MLERINTVSVEMESRVDTLSYEESTSFKQNTDLIYDLIDSNIDILKEYSRLSKIYSKSYAAMFINNMVSESILSDEHILTIDNHTDLLNYLSDKIIPIEYSYNDYHFSISFNIGAFITLCNFGGYSVAINEILKELNMYMFNQISMTTKYSAKDLHNILQNMKNINDELADSKKGILADMYAGIDTIKKSKITDIIPMDDIQNMLGASRLFFASQQHGEFGDIICNAIERNIDKPGMEALSGMYVDVSKEPEKVAAVVEDVMSKMQYGDLKVDEAMAAMTQNLRDNKSKFASQ